MLQICYRFIFRVAELWLISFNEIITATEICIFFFYFTSTRFSLYLDYGLSVNNPCCTLHWTTLTPSGKTLINQHTLASICKVPHIQNMYSHATKYFPKKASTLHSSFVLWIKYSMSQAVSNLLSCTSVKILC